MIDKYMNWKRPAAQFSSAVSSVSFVRSGGAQPVHTKSGAYVYSGSPSLFYEWEFRTRLTMKQAGNDPEKYAAAMAKVVDGLRDDAFIIARELGLDVISTPGTTASAPTAAPAAADGDEEDPFDEGRLLGDSMTTQQTSTTQKPGVDILVEEMKKMVFPRVDQEARELFKQYTKTHGALCRQQGESMQHYVGRRKRAWKLLQQLDPSMNLSEEHRADLLLEQSGISKTEITMIQASIGNKRDYDLISEALIAQHPRVHTTVSDRQTRPTGKGKRRKGQGKGKVFSKGKSQGRGKGWRPNSYLAIEDSAVAYNAVEDEGYVMPAYYHEDDPDSAVEDYDYDNHAYVAHMYDEDGYSYETDTGASHSYADPE